MGHDDVEMAGLLQRLSEGLQLSPDEAIRLVERAELPVLGLAAREAARLQNPEGLVGFVVDQTILYSNVCQPNCPFCNGTVTADDPRAFTLTPEEVVEKARPAVAAGAQQIILQGGHRIDLPWEYYLDLIRSLKEAYPGIAVAAYSPTEILVMAASFGRSTREVMTDLKEAGLDLLLSGGAEALGWLRQKENRILLRGPWNDWFDVLHRAHDLGIPVIGMVPFGLGETARERVGLLYRIRAVQFRTSRRGEGVFRALVPYDAGAPPALGESLPAGLPWPEAGPASPSDPTGYEYLRMVAFARLLVDNVPRIQASFLTQGAKVAQVALAGGADDFGGTQFQCTRVELAAGRFGRMTPEEVQRLVRDAGLIPARRSPTYAILERLEPQ